MVVSRFRSIQEWFWLSLTRVVWQLLQNPLSACQSVVFEALGIDVILHVYAFELHFDYLAYTAQAVS